MNRSSEEEDDENAQIVMCLGALGFLNIIETMEELNRMIEQVSMDNQQRDTWKWALNGNGLYKCKVLAKLLDEKMLNTTTSTAGTLRNNLVPKKIEVFVWRVNKGRIPILVELDKRGIDLHSVRCPLCDNDIECLNHALVKCDKVRELWKKIFKWWNITQTSTISIKDILEARVGQIGSDLGQKLWQATLWSSVYHVWKNRNEMVFKGKGWTVPVTLGEIQVKSFEWVVKRCKEKDIDWHGWLHNPYSVSN